MKRNQIVARVLLTFARSGVLAVALLLLYIVWSERVAKYLRNGIMQQQNNMETTEPWFETAICFGPKLTKHAITQYMEEINKQSPGKYISIPATFYAHRNTRENTFNASARIFPGSINVDNVMRYGEFFQNTYHWTGDVLDLVSRPVVQLSGHLDSLEHRLTLDDEDIDESQLSHSDIPFLLHYSLCRNFSYDIKYSEGPDERDFVHELSMKPETHKKLMQGGYAHYVDIFVYPRGRFSEFPLLAERMAYRVDMSQHQLLRVNARKMVKLAREEVVELPGGSTVKFARRETKNRTDEWVCHKGHHYSYMNCITWRLMQSLLDELRCIMPMMIPYIYNTTEVMLEIAQMVEENNATASSNASQHTSSTTAAPNVTDSAQPKERGIHFLNTFTEDKAWPWMTNYTKLSLCKSAEQFNHTYGILIETLYPRGNVKFPFCPDCGSHCKVDCEDYRVILNLAGTRLIVDEEEMPPISHKKPKSNQTMQTTAKPTAQLIAKASMKAQEKIDVLKNSNKKAAHKANGTTTTTPPGTKSDTDDDNAEYDRAPLSHTNGVSITFSTALDTVTERWIYSVQQLAIDMTGVLSFLLGASILTLYDIIFFVVENGMQRTGLLEKDPNKKFFYL